MRLGFCDNPSLARALGFEHLDHLLERLLVRAGRFDAEPGCCKRRLSTLVFRVHVRTRFEQGLRGGRLSTEDRPVKRGLSVLLVSGLYLRAAPEENLYRRRAPLREP